MRSSLLAFAAAAGCATALLAAEAPAAATPGAARSASARPAAAPSASDASELEAVLEQETDLATRSKMNADFVPGMLSILHGDELEALGAQTVLDALSLVPGIQTFKERNGFPNLSVRGVTYPFNAGNTKILVNGISISRENAGVNSSALLMRIEQVDHIEVTRGPSSGVYGAFAYAGVINIITRKDASRAFAAGGELGMGAAGVVHTFHDTSGSSKLTINSAGYQGKLSEGPFNTDPSGSGSDSVVQFERGNFALTYQQVERGQRFTSPFFPVPVDSPEHSSVLDVRQRFTHGTKADSELHVTYSDTKFGTGEQNKLFIGDRVDLQYELHWRPVEKHSILARAEAAHEVFEFGTLALVPLPSILDSTIRGKTRRIHAASIQDQIDLNKNTTLTVGVRGDTYSDVGAVVTPRVALAYRASRRDILKAQYTQGFRPPTWFEIYAPGFRDDNLGFEVIATSELGWVRRGARAVTRVTVFESRVRDVLFPILPPPQLPTFFNNDERIRTRGAELEWSTQLTKDLRALANVSVVDTRDTRATSGPSLDSAVAADTLGNLGLEWRPTKNFTLAGRLKHVGTRHIAAGTTDGYDTFDLTASGNEFPAHGWTTRVGVQNLFDDKVTYLEALPGFTDISTFETRMAWARVSASF